MFLGPLTWLESVLHYKTGSVVLFSSVFGRIKCRILSTLPGIWRPSCESCGTSITCLDEREASFHEYWWMQAACKFWKFLVNEHSWYVAFKYFVMLISCQDPDGIIQPLKDMWRRNKLSGALFILFFFFF